MTANSNFTVLALWPSFKKDYYGNSLKRYVHNHKAFIAYGFISVFVTVIDIIVYRFCEQYTNPVVANTIGVVTGFILQFFLTARHVYNTKSIKSFLIFFATFLLNLSIISPRSFNLNYISNLSFVMPLLAAYFLNSWNLSNNTEFAGMSKIIGIAIPVFMTISAFVVKPNYINGDFRVFDSILSNYSDSPCVYYQANKNSPPISQDMAQLVQFKNVFVTDGTDYSLTADYIQSQDSKETLIVYVDATAMGNFQVNDILNYYLDEMDYSSYKLLYKYECSECYVFYKKLLKGLFNALTGKSRLKLLRLTPNGNNGFNQTQETKKTNAGNDTYV